MQSLSRLPRQTQQLFVALSLAVISFSLVSIQGIPFIPLPYTPKLESMGYIPVKHEQMANNPQTGSKTGQVLGSYTRNTPTLFLSGGENSYTSGGLIAMSTQSDPFVNVDGYNLSGKFTVSVYKADINAVLKYLEYDSDFKQKNKEIDTTGMQQLTSFDQDLNSTGGTPQRLDLPVKDAGVYYVRLQSAPLTAHAFIVRSNFGAVAKKADHEVVLWAQDFDTMRRLPGVTYTTYSLSNGQQQLSSGQTDDDGIAKVNIDTPPDLAILKKDDRVALIPLNLQYLSSWGVYSYTPFKQTQRQTKFFTFTDRPLYRPGDKVYFKSILRDDDDARYTIPSGTAKVTLSKGYNDQDGVIFSKQLPISSDGTLDGDINLADDVPTGYYILKVALSDTLVSYQYFQIDYFRKPEYSVSVEATQRQIVSQDDVSFDINGSFFSGQPLANKEVTYKVLSGDYYEYEYYYPENALSNDYRYGGYWGSESITEGTATLDVKGKATVHFKSKMPKVGSSQVYSIEVSYEDDTGNPSFDRKNILVFDGEYRMYRSPNTPYSSRINEKAQLDLTLKSNVGGTVANIPLTAAVTRSNWVEYQDPNQKYPSYREEKESLPSLSAKSDAQGNVHFEFVPQKVGSYDLMIDGKDNRGNVIERHFYLYVTDQNGTLYNSANQNSLSLHVDKDLYQPNENVNATLTSQYPYRDVLLTFERGRLNRYQVVQMNGVTSSLSLPLQNTDIPDIYLRATSFSGNDFDDSDVEVKLNTDSKKLKMTLTPDRTNYGPGDEVKVNVQTTDTKGNPLSADVAVWSVDKAIFELVDQHPEKIFDTFWEERYLGTATTHSLQGITVNGAEAGGGCFVGGTLVTLANGTQKPIEELKVGDRLLTRSSASSDELVTVEVKNTHQQKDTGYFIINGSLKVTPDHYLWLNDQWQTADQIQVGDQLWSTQSGTITISSVEWVTQATTVYNLETSGNHTFLADGFWVHNQKDGGARTIFKDTSYWNPHVQTDGSGRAQVVFKLPDNLTTWVIAGIGATRDTVVGDTTEEIKVSKGVVMRPVLPNVLQQDDPLLVEGIVQNFTNQAQTFSVSLGFDSGEVWPTDTQSVSVPANDSGVVKWDVVPRKITDAAKLTFSAKTNQPSLSDTIVQQIPVQPFGFLQESAQTGTDATTFKIALPTKLVADKSSVTVNLASSIITTLPAAINYLIDYPYGCVEQTTSRFVPTVIAATNSALFKDALDGKDINKIIVKGVNRLQTLQQGNGGWSWWGNRDSDPFISAYVVEYLLKAKDAGYPVDGDMLSFANNYFRSVEVKSDSDEVARDYALALMKSDQARKVTNFDSLSPDLLSIAVMTNITLGNHDPSTNGLARLTAMAQTQGKEVFWEKGNNAHFGSREASTALAARAIMMGKGDQQMVTGAMQYLLNHRTSYYWGNTFATAQIIQAVSDYSQVSKELTPNYNYQVSIDGVSLASGTVSSVKTPIKPIQIPLKSIKADGTSMIEIKKTGDGQLYSTLVNKSFVSDKQTPAISHGATLTRRYLSSNNEEVIPAVGDYVTVELTVDGLKESDSYGVIQDHLPAGMIPVNITFDNQQAQQTQSYWRYSEGISNVEYTEDGAILSLYYVKAGPQKFSYKARVVSQGEFTPSPAKFSLMYNPEVYAQTGISKIKIGNESIVIPHPGEPQSTVGNKQQEIDRNWKFITGATLLLVFFGITFALEARKQKKRTLTAQSQRPTSPDQPPTPPHNTPTNPDAS